VSDRPNILFINTDQHSWDAISAYGNPWLSTPAIDCLHDNGTSFVRSYCSDPVCAPARASWMTGLYTSECGVPFNGGHLHEDIPDLGQLLTASGYNAYHCNKWHVGGRAIDAGFKVLWGGKRRVPAGGAGFYDPVATHAAIDFLATYDQAQPFYLQIGFVNPHDICEYGHNLVGKTVPGATEQGFVPEAELPPLPENFDYDKSETVQQIVIRRGKDALIHGDIYHAMQEWGELDWRLFLWNYYRFIEKVDREIGLVLRALENSPHRDNTLILFSTDHGESGGCHQMFQKFTLYEESIHVPFIVSSLGDSFGIEKGRFDRDHFVSGVDLLPTVCDYAKAEIPEAISGRSLRPLVEQRDTPWRDYAYVESNYWGRAIITDRFKYVTEYRPKDKEDFVPPGPDNARLGREQLFETTLDPGERTNLASVQEYAEDLNALRAKLHDIERTLHRRRMHPQCENGITRWARHIKAYEESHGSSPRR
jgi:arylsulfatase A-like enzyme